MANETATPKSILLFGATGVIGTFLVNELASALQAGTFTRLAIFTSQSTVSTKPEVIKSLQSRGVEIFAGDIADKALLTRVLTGEAAPLNPGKYSTPFDTLISAAGRAAILSQLPILEVAEQVQSVKRFYPSEFGTDIAHKLTNDAEPPHQLKLQVRKYIRENVKRLDVTYLVTGPYSDLWLRKPPGGAEWVGGFDVKSKKAVVLGNGKGRVAFTSMEDVAKLLLASLLHPAESRNKALKVRSFITTPLDVVAEFEKRTGGEKWDVEFVDLDFLRRKEKEAYESKSPLGTAHTLRRIWAEGGTLYSEEEGGWDNGRIGFEGKEEGLGSQVGKAIAFQEKGQ